MHEATHDVLHIQLLLFVYCDLSEQNFLWSFWVCVFSQKHTVYYCLNRGSYDAFHFMCIIVSSAASYVFMRYALINAHLKIFDLHVYCLLLFVKDAAKFLFCVL